MAGQLIRREDLAGTERRAPFLASDGWRTIIAGALALIPGTAFDELLERLDLGPDEFMSGVQILLSSFLFGWIFFAGIYGLLTAYVFARADGETFARWLRESMPRSRSSRIVHAISGGSNSTWTTNGSVIAVLAVLVLSLVPELRSSPLVVGSGVAAVAASWLLNAVSYAVHYARTDVHTLGLRFPGEETPVFGDYFYLAVQVATSYSSGDVTARNRPVRRAITRQSMLSFLFNTVIIAVLVAVLVSSAG